MSTCPNCNADNLTDFPVCPTCAATCHFDARADCRCGACRRLTEIARAAALELVARLETRIKFLEARLGSERKPELYTTEEVADLLGVSMNTLSNWRKGKPVIPFILFEGGGIRYHAEEIDRYLKSRERGAKASLRVA